MAGDDTVTMQDKRSHRPLVQRFRRGRSLSTPDMPYDGLHDTRRACERSRICTEELRTGSYDAGRGNDASRGLLRTRFGSRDSSH
ncbi:Uncharacterised protein [Bifidobacterium breve]|nr:Uncharacterised protein [Bifidobacterium breve]